MTQTNPKEKFTVFNLAHDETIYYVMSPMETWRKNMSDNESAAKALNLSLDKYLNIYKETDADIKEINNYTMISFKNKKTAQSIARKLNKLYKNAKG